ncbi:MAG: Small-conductance mechanosensitive channel [Thermoleophilia bacterium]|nr:Small-conductance mechanosensitive channel [Thermoleophilia bacterium]MCZ4496482.1 Small-conductance mechanosensitive channel [Thermoleophilia bacterium]
MEQVRELWHDLDAAPAWLTAVILIVLVLGAAVATRRILARILRRTYGRRIDTIAADHGVADLARIKRQKTLVTLLESVLRYAVYGAALVVILAILAPGTASAIFGASLLVVLVGFGFQRLLADVVAGALLLFEGHFAVGDLITVHPTDVTGVVEEFSLRTTTLRTLADDRVMVTNGSLINFTRWSYGQREFRLELLARGAQVGEVIEAACASIGAAPDSLWVRPPSTRAMVQAGDDLWRMTLTAVVAPGHDVLVEQFATQLEALLGESLLGDVLVVPLHAPAYERYRAGVLVRD